MAIHNPHDHFIKDILAEHNHSVELLKEIIPHSINQILDWTTLKQEADSFVDDELHEYFSDALFAVQTKNKYSIKIYLLFEHKSQPEKRIHFQLLNYLTRIYTQQKTPEPVLPVVFYHGKKEWKIPSSFSQIFGLSEEEQKLLGKFIPDFEYALYDVSKKEMQAIQASATIRSVLQLMKTIWDLEKDPVLHEWLRISEPLIQDEASEKILVKILTYVYILTDIDATKMSNAISRLAPKRGDIAMSTAEKLIQQGMQKGKIEGMQQGMQKAKLEIARDMLREGAELSFILKVTGLTEEDLKKAGIRTKK